MTEYLIATRAAIILWTGLAVIPAEIGRVHTSYAAEGYSFLPTFPLTEAERRADGAAHVVLLKRRKRRRPQRLQASG